MTLRERGKLGNEMARRRAEARREAFARLLNRAGLKRAAHAAGVSERTARRYAAQMREQA